MAGTTILDLLTTTTPLTLDGKVKADIIGEVAAAVRAEFKVETLRAPTDAEREAIRARIAQLAGQSVRRRGLSAVSYQEEQDLAAEIVRRMLGLGFLDLLLPPARRDLSEIALDPFGIVWVKRKGVREFEALPDMRPDPVEVDTVFSTLFGQQLKAYSEANPSVNAVLPRTRHNPGGGRVKYIHPVIAQGAGFPSVNIRLFEPEPVKPERLLAWGMFDEPTLDLLAFLVRRHMRGFIAGGTSSGKTILLSMLCNFLPVNFRGRYFYARAEMYKAADGAALAASAEVDVPLYQATGQIVLMPSAYGVAQTYAAFNSDYLASRRIFPRVTAIRVDQATRTVYVRLAADASSLFPSILGGVMVTGEGQAEARLQHR